jgi:predicted DsbA family dithiol-disulfide isomerase
MDNGKHFDMSCVCWIIKTNLNDAMQNLCYQFCDIKTIWSSSCQMVKQKGTIHICDKLKIFGINSLVRQIVPATHDFK